jgi:hypothetical protein
MASSRGNGRGSGLSGREVVGRVRRELPELLGHPIESVLGFERDDDGGWRVTVQVVELSRIPHTTDVLGAYVVTVDGDGEVTGYQRARRFHRNAAGDD